LVRRSNGEGSIAKRRDGKWSAAYIVGGKRKYLYWKTRKEAATKLRDAMAGQDKGNYYSDIRLEDYLGQWLEDSVGARSGRGPTRGTSRCPATTSSPSLGSPASRL